MCKSHTVTEINILQTPLNSKCVKVEHYGWKSDAKMSKCLSKYHSITLICTVNISVLCAKNNILKSEKWKKKKVSIHKELQNTLALTL